MKTKKLVDYTFASDTWKRKQKDFIEENSYKKATVRLNRMIDKLYNDEDCIRIYAELMSYYVRVIEAYYMENEEIGTGMGYYYLAAKAVEAAQYLYNNQNVKTKISKVMAENEYGHRAVCCAIIAGEYELARRVMKKDSMMGFVLENDKEKILARLKQKDDDAKLNTIYKAIAEKDVKLLEKGICERLSYLRKLKYDYISIIDEWLVALIKLAKKAGMTVEINVAEVPKDLLEDVAIDYEKWKLPLIKELEGKFN